MRLYTFTNYYLSSIQQGIQPLHAAVEMMAKYHNLTGPAAEQALDWARNHRTVVCLNGGNAADITIIDQLLQTVSQALNLPYASFCEDEQSLSGTMTSACIVVPERIYATAQLIRERKLEVPYSIVSDHTIPCRLHNTTELELALLINRCSLAH